jgi:hypothetical protein
MDNISSLCLQELLATMLPPVKMSREDIKASPLNIACYFST